MATVASRLLRAAARSASLTSRTATAAASRTARSARAAAAAARAARLGSGVIAPLESCPTRSDASTTTKPRDEAPQFSLDEYYRSPEYNQLPDDVNTPTEKDLESDETIWAFYECWCKAHNKQHDHAEMARRFKLFRYYAKDVHWWNTYLPPDPKKAAIYIRNRRRAKLRLSKEQDVSHFDECYLPMELGPFADGADPSLTESDERLLKSLEEKDDTAQWFI